MTAMPGYDPFAGYDDDIDDEEDMGAARKRRPRARRPRRKRKFKIFTETLTWDNLVAAGQVTQSFAVPLPFRVDQIQAVAVLHADTAISGTNFVAGTHYYRGDLPAHGAAGDDYVPSLSLITAKIEEKGYPWMTDFTPLTLFTGTGIAPFWLPHKHVVAARSSVNVDLINNSAYAVDVYMTFLGARVFG
ncbi:MAG: hypothetical protein KAS72_07810 [Phycisphaerales bacterium]|nr:hypothetical protein [Phycisphaerales bacterium]